MWLRGKEATCHMQETQEMQVHSLGQEDALEKEMAAHSSVLALKIPWTKETVGLQSAESQRAGHDERLSTNTTAWWPGV